MGVKLNNAYDGSVKLTLSWFKNVGIKIGFSWEKRPVLCWCHYIYTLDQGTNIRRFTVVIVIALSFLQITSQTYGIL